tara:strand:- start:622 stop:840 length:219 start_codon:yes stop_codon:yes gene_type:complete
MPFYNWKCKKCETVWEIFQTMTERDQNPPEYCQKCDPECLEEEGTLFQVHFAGSTPKFKITGEGAYYPDKLQ